VLGILAFALFALAVNMTAALLAMAGLLGYVFVYTIWLKPITSQNIVIGGAAGAVPPLVGWAAAAGQLDASAFYLFAIVFYWTPPHFWALALLIKDDYARTGIPMLPVVDGEPETRRQILLYGWLLLAITALPLAGGLFGALYAASALVLGAGFIALCIRLHKRADRRSASLLFHYSLLYLALLFVTMALDHAVV
jgi:heme o synthase